MYNIAFVVGCEEYDQDNIDNLTGVNDDVVSMQDVLISHCDCSRENVYSVTSQPDSVCEPTATKILDLIIQKAKKHNDEFIDNIFFYFSGHGYLSAQNKVCLVLKDSMISPIIIGTVEVESIISALKQFDNVKHIILFLDICQNEITTKGVIGDQIIPSDYFPRGVVIFFSCFPKNASYMIPQGAYNEYGKGSVFTKCLVDSLRPQNKCHSVKEISAYLKKEVTNLSGQLGFDQKPYTQTEDISLDDIIIASHFEGNDFELSYEERIMLEAVASHLISGGNISLYSKLGAQTEQKMANLMSSFSKFISASSYLNMLSVAVSPYLLELKRIKEDIKSTLKYYLPKKEKPPFLLELEVSTFEFQQKMEINNNKIYIATQELARYERLFSNIMQEFYLYIVSIEFALKISPETEAEILNGRVTTLRSHMESYERFGSFILKHKQIFNDLVIQTQSLINLCVPLCSKLDVLFYTQGSIEEFFSHINEVINGIHLLDESISRL